MEDVEEDPCGDVERCLQGDLQGVSLAEVATRHVMAITGYQPPGISPGLA
jgi:hypothetical protein